MALEWFEESPWFHKVVSFCTREDTDKETHKSFACKLIFDFGFTLLIELVNLRDVFLCAMISSATGDPSVCLALTLTKIAFPQVLQSSEDSPYAGLGNVHL